MASVIAKLRMKFSPRSTSHSLMIVGLDNSGKTSILNCLTGGRQVQSDVGVGNSPRRKTDIRPNAARSNDGNIVPTVGYNYERIQVKNLTITVLDFSGQTRYRNLWQEFCNGVDAIVFVIDSSDIIRLVVARDELETLLNHPYFLFLNSQSHLGISPDFLLLQANDIIDGPQTVQKQLTVNRGRLIQETINQQAQRNVKRRTKVPILFLANKSDLSSSVGTDTIIKALNLDELLNRRHPWHIQATSANLNQGVKEGFDWLADQLSN